ncbi:hypothetical protein BJ944DRAFT_260423 [Cunninghamella echinulata]|nr:hypothetical protein BJ944DRAFT_260423 [Cunninghamella echinulata]
MAVSNTPKAIIKGWATLSVLALGGYLFSKSYTNRQLQDYISKNGSVTTSGVQDSTQQDHDNNNNNSGERPLKRSVQRSL